MNIFNKPHSIKPGGSGEGAYVLFRIPWGPTLGPQVGPGPEPLSSLFRIVVQNFAELLTDLGVIIIASMVTKCW